MSDKNWDILFHELNKINGRLDQMDARLDQMDKRLEQVESRLDKVEHRLDKLEAGQQRHEDLLQQLIHITGNINTRVIRLEDEVATIKANQATMLGIQQDQQKILERLSVRSISHEADIAELRRIK